MLTLVYIYHRDATRGGDFEVEQILHSSKADMKKSAWVHSFDRASINFDKGV